MANRWTYFFSPGQTEGDPDRKDILGGKGASLAAMSRAGLPVPPGFTISAECCRLFLGTSGRWPAGLEDEVRQSLARLEEAAGRRFGDPARPLLVSVRSGAAVSMPGMMDTILNCGLSPEMAAAAGFWSTYVQFIRMFGKTVAGIAEDSFDAACRDAPAGKHAHAAPPPTPERYRDLAARCTRLYEERARRPFPATPWLALVECIDAVFRSWNSPRAITYRQANDVRGADGTAVTVQSMFPSEVSGILFTANPTDLAADEMIIESSYGLGESVVSGDVHPDRFTVCRKGLTLKHQALGHKSRLVAALGDAARRDPDAPSLVPEEVLALARTGLEIERFFGRPMDIEWGLAGGRFALLQARPIRGLDIAEDVEIGRTEEIHRLRQRAEKHRKVWVLHNLSETLRYPTPLTWDVVRRLMSGDGGVGRMYKAFGYRPSDEVCREGFLELICGRIYADTDRAADLFWDGMPLTYDPAEVAERPRVLESAPTRFDPDKATGRFFVGLPRLVWSMLESSRRMKPMRRAAVRRFTKEILPPYLAWIDAKRRQDLTALPTRQVLAELRDRVARVVDDFAGESLKPGYFGGVALASLEQRLCQLMGNAPGIQQALLLTQGLDGDTTVEQNILLWRVARGEATVEDFLARFGHRTVGEMELATPRWAEDSTYVRQIIAAYAGGAAGSPLAMHEANAGRRQAADLALPETLRLWGGSSFTEEILADLADARAMLPYREIGKHYLMMGWQVLRLALVELARRWDLGRDLFFLRLDELPRWEADRADLEKQIAARKVRWQSARRLEMPETVDSAHLDTLGLAVKHAAATELAGEPIASGVATGAARVIFDPQQAAGIATDYILVCPSTDPGWTALFVHARGLIVEQGGMLSHGAIVARDFGIPAVVCPGATSRIADGTKIRVDGNSGRITFVDEARGSGALTT